MSDIRSLVRAGLREKQRKITFEVRVMVMVMVMARVGLEVVLCAASMQYNTKRFEMPMNHNRSNIKLYCTVIHTCCPVDRESRESGHPGYAVEEPLVH